MSLERELVFQLRNDGSTPEDVRAIARSMADPNGNGRAVRTNPRKIEVALSQYNAKEELKKRGKYKKSFKDKVRQLIEEKKREIEDSYPNLLSLKITKDSGYFCSNCTEEVATRVDSKIKYLNEKGKIPVQQIEEKSLLKYCDRCGDIVENE